MEGSPTQYPKTYFNMRPMGHISHLRKQFKSINTFIYSSGSWEEVENRKSLQTDDGWKAIRKAHLSFQLRWAKNFSWLSLRWSRQVLKKINSNVVFLYAISIQWKKRFYTIILNLRSFHQWKIPKSVLPLVMKYYLWIL